MRYPLRLWRTARHLRARQLVNRCWRRWYQPSAPARPLPPLRRRGTHWVVPPAPESEWTDAHTVTILARTAQVREPRDWHDAFSDELRRYHLHYLDQLRATREPSPGFGAQLLLRWIADNPQGSSPGWDPYPISRRLVNVIKHALAGNECTPQTQASLALQCRHLLARLEFHLLGNHLLANAKALIFAGTYFAGAEADGWLRRGRRLLHSQLREQICSDGGHIERTPMYHALVLEDLLDLYNLGRAYEASFLVPLAGPCEQMQTWLAALCHPDRDIGFFNDATLGVALRLDELSAYAHTLGIGAADPRFGTLLHLPASGYVRLSSHGWQVLADVGSVGPSYQPGHAHAQTLSYELSYRHERVIVNTGVSTYAADSTRAAERGTAAHNAVTLDGIDSSEVWSSFRVGARARVTAFSAGEDADAAWACGTHDGYRRRTRYRALHKRQWRTSADGVEIMDELTGRGAPQAEIAIHLHPDCQVRRESAQRVGIVTRGGARLVLSLDAGLDWNLEEYGFAPAFGVQRAACVLRGRAQARLPLTARVFVSAALLVP